MTMEAERIFKYSNVGRDTRKRKHLVAAKLPSSPFSAHCKSAHHHVHFSTPWPTPALISSFVVIFLLSTWILHQENVGNTPSLIMERFTARIAKTTTFPCSGHGYLEIGDTGTQAPICKCHECFGGRDCAEVVPSCVIDLDHGDPTMFEEFWFQNGERSVTVILGYQRMSYFAQSKHVWFMEKEVEEQIRALHRVVGNAVTDGRYIVVGTGSTQLFQAALYALTAQDQPAPTRIVSAVPFYSSYPAVTDYLRSALFKWAGDAASFDTTDGQPFIELVTSPNNPDGRIQHAIVKKSAPQQLAHVVHDLAYFWPHYTPITAAADHDIMLFTLSKSTGHAGTRIGWAILKDETVAKRMMKFMELNTIGVSHDSQVRATHILRAVVEGYDAPSDASSSTTNKLFHFGAARMQYRWSRLRSALNASAEFAIPEFSPAECTFFHQNMVPTPAFAWLRCLKAKDCEEMLKTRRIITRSGRHFGVGAEFVRLSMLDRSRKFEMLVDRLARIDSSRTPG